MNTFDALPKDKQDRIINAALSTFAVHGYRKASVSDIARAAGISKAMVFTYFGSKAELYEFLLHYIMRVTLDTLERVKPQLAAITDYFERYIFTAQIKLDLMKINRAIMDFSASMYTERDPEVRPAIEATIADAFKIRDMFVTSGIDAKKFKDPNDVAKMDKFIRWLSEGCLDEWKSSDTQDDIVALFHECFDALKHHYYKEEYLSECNPIQTRSAKTVFAYIPNKNRSLQTLRLEMAKFKCRQGRRTKSYRVVRQGRERSIRLNLAISSGFE
jgi:AcrR family transcriptional regulator